MVQWRARTARSRASRRNQNALDHRRRAEVRRIGRRGAAALSGHPDGPALLRPRPAESCGSWGELYRLVSGSARLLADAAVFFLINSYTTGLQRRCFQHAAHDGFKGARRARGTRTRWGCPSESGGVLPCGASGRGSHDRFVLGGRPHGECLVLDNHLLAVEKPPKHAHAGGRVPRS